MQKYYLVETMNGQNFLLSRSEKEDINLSTILKDGYLSLQESDVFVNMQQTKQGIRTGFLTLKDHPVYANYHIFASNISMFSEMTKESPFVKQYISAKTGIVLPNQNETQQVKKGLHLVK